MMQICDDKHCNIMYKIQLMNAIKKWLHVWNWIWLIVGSFLHLFFQVVIRTFGSCDIPQICLSVWPHHSWVSHVTSGDYPTFLSPEDPFAVWLGCVRFCSSGSKRDGLWNVSRWPRGSQIISRRRLSSSSGEWGYQPNTRPLIQRQLQKLTLSDYPSARGPRRARSLWG